MKNGLNISYASVLIALLCGNTVFAQQTSESYMVNGDATTWKSEESIRAATVWPSTDATSDANWNTTYDWAPPRPIKPVKPISANQPKNTAAPYSFEDPFLEQIEQDENDEQDEDIKSTNDETDDNDERDKMEEPPAELELEDPTATKPGTIDAINPLRSPISALTIDVRDYSDDKPSDESSRFTDERIEDWSAFAPQPSTFAWAAPNIRYQPLYFENVPLERYGQIRRRPIVETAAGAVHFYRSLVLLPYHLRVDCAKSCDYPLGFCRPGDPTYKVKQYQCWGTPHRLSTLKR